VSPRPRKASDEDIFAAAVRAMGRLAPSELTLAEIAREAGVTAGALVQRFGSKRRLQVALAEAAARSAGEMIRGLAQRHESPIDAIRDYAECMAGLASSPEALTRNLAYLTQDVSDPELRRNLLVQSRATRDALGALLDEGVGRGELRSSTDTRQLARTLESLIGGALFAWAVYREGSARRFVRDQVDAVLAPHLTPRRSPSRKKAP
jgi:AcrR family transcriptional regulator